MVLPSTLSNVYSGAFTCSYQNGKTTRTINRTYILLGDEPFKYSALVQTDFYGLWLPANIDAIAGDHFYVKESALEKYVNSWKSGISSTYFDYKIPFVSHLSYSTNCREFDTDYHVAIGNGNKPYVATDYVGESVTFTSVDNDIVPAGTAVLIRKTSDENTWYQIAEQQGAQLSMANYLKGVTYADEISPNKDDGFTNYVLNGDEFQRLTDAITIDDHSGYLQLPETSTQKYSISLSDDADGITMLHVEKTFSDKIYGINGVHTVNPEHGIYIKNGKKIVIK